MKRGWMRSACPAWMALLVLAGVLIAVWGVMHLAGWREHTGLFSVAIPADAAQERALVKGAAYAGAHLLLVLAVPVLVGAGLIFLALERTRR